MRKIIASFLTAVILIASGAPALAATSSDLRQAWLEAQQARYTADAAYRQAQIDYQADKTPENDQKVIEALKDLMNAALDEVEAWLRWKDAEAQSDPRVPDDLKSAISEDVAANLLKISGYRDDVAGVDNRLEAIAVFLKLVGGYAELVTDVARNIGAVWVSVGNSWISTTESYEAKLRSTAEEISDNTEIIAALDAAQIAIVAARANVAAASDSYSQVRLPGMPLVKFAQGNASLRLARAKLLEAQAQLVRALTLISASSR